MGHKCIIGLLHKADDSELVTIDDLVAHSENEKEFFGWLKENGYNLFPGNRTHHYSLKDYADFRKNTDLARFKHCPECGKKIDWKAIKKRDT